MHNVRTKRDSKQLSEETDLEQLYFGEWRGAGAVVARVLEEKLFNVEAQRSQRRRGGKWDLNEGECGAPTALELVRNVCEWSGAMMKGFDGTRRRLEAGGTK